MTTIRKPYGPRYDKAVINQEGEITLTKLSMQEETNINNIMAKYVKTGHLEHVKEHQNNYGFADSIDFQTAMETITTAQTMFDDLPAETRKRFQNEPGQFLDFVQDANNLPEMEKMGLLIPDFITEDTVPETPPGVVESGVQPAAGGQPEITPESP